VYRALRQGKIRRSAHPDPMEDSPSPGARTAGTVPMVSGRWADVPAFRSCARDSRYIGTGRATSPRSSGRPRSDVGCAGGEIHSARCVRFSRGMSRGSPSRVPFPAALISCGFIADLLRSRYCPKCPWNQPERYLSNYCRLFSHQPEPPPPHPSGCARQKPGPNPDQDGRGSRPLLPEEHTLMVVSPTPASVHHVTPMLYSGHECRAGTTYLYQQPSGHLFHHILPARRQSSEKTS
jgi:hypothetical protein